ncbi:hypothetical protein E2C01_071107 [Portunus trituberculatus]|uniref:Uncharacterized protein n=1 Tax=Portunus trituberculatus TaxID=210409 RepID=A0A5B7I352_PORTR|nr:hypothetical protein [Portunus trituberculatus]
MAVRVWKRNGRHKPPFEILKCAAVKEKREGICVLAVHLVGGWRAGAVEGGQGDTTT